ncbi:MAG: metallophosphoesterase [Flavobacteriales bacterium]|jgi:uncharacterized protein
MIKIILAFILLIELYIFFILRSVYSNNQFVIAVSIQIFVALFTAFSLFYTFSSLGHGLSQTTKSINILMGLFVAFGVAKMVFISIIFLEDVTRLISYVVSYFTSSDSVDFSSRRKAITNIGLGIAAVPFSAFIYGMFKTRYDFKVFRNTLEIDKLPKAFEGLRIVQISDFHAGSLDNMKAIKLGLEKIQNLEPDLLLFTGDLVNNTSEEFDKFIPYFKSLTASIGKFSIMGNHDYGLYYNWGSEEEKKANEQRIRNHHKSIGFDLLENQSRRIEKNGAILNLIGVENWGRPPFPPKGDLDLAITDIKQDSVTILMSHDPHHWEDKVIPHSQKVDLTLSGHTHGMQMGIELPGFKWSPVSLRYKRWAGLYKENNQYLYVNRGFGHIGFPGRVGIKPEITFLELVAKK